MSESHNFGRHSNHIFIGIAIVCTAILIAIFSSEGFADFSTSTVTQSLIGQRTNLDSSFTIKSLLITTGATNSMAGSATTTTTFEIANPFPTIRLNTLNSGDAYYRLQINEASTLTSGTWILRLYSDGVQVGDTITLTQNTPDNGVEGVDVLVSFGSASIPSSSHFYAEVIKTA